MKKLNLLIIVSLIILLSGCSLQEKFYNNIINTVIEYNEVSIEDFNSMTEVATQKAGASSIAIVASKSSIILASSSLGSGVIIKREKINAGYKYYALTNRHVVETRGTISNNIKIIYDGNEDNAIAGKVEYFDVKLDIALITFETGILFSEATIKSSATLKKGSFIIAYGTPHSLEYFGTASFGIVSHPSRIIVDELYNSTMTIKNIYIQHDAPINSGNSGGGLFDIYGNLIGINTLKLIGDSSDEPIEGIGFAIAIDEIKNINELKYLF